jgi:hypothetical protein
VTDLLADVVETNHIHTGSERSLRRY